MRLVSLAVIGSLISGLGACGDSAAPQPDAGDGGPPPGAKRIFVTSVVFDGDLKSRVPGSADGLAAADALCQNAASSTALGGTWVAWLSAPGTDALSRINDVGPWYLLNGTKAFEDKFNLGTTPLAAISITEQMGTAVGSERVWTGTKNGGTERIGKTCQGWTTDTTQLQVGGIGLLFPISEWTNGDPGVGFDEQSCADLARLYCIEQ